MDYAVKKVKTDSKTEVRHILQGERRRRSYSSLHGILEKDRGEGEKAVGSQKAQGFISRSQRQRFLSGRKRNSGGSRDEKQGQ